MQQITPQDYQPDRASDSGFSVYRGNHIQSVIFIEIPNLGIQNCHRTLPPRSVLSNNKSGDRSLKTYIKNVCESFWRLGNKTLD